MSRRKLHGVAGGGTASRKTVPLRIGNAHHHPFAAARFERIFHGHAAIERSLPVRMKRNGGEGFIFVKGDIRRGKAHAIEIKTGVSVETLDNGLLHFFLTLQRVPAGSDGDERDKDNG